VDGNQSWDLNEKRLLNALGAPAGAGGLVATLEFVTDCLSTAQDRHRLAKISAWHGLCCAMHRKATDLAQVDPTLAAPPPDPSSRLAPRTYRHFAAAASGKEQRAGTERLNVATAMIILHAAGEGGTVPDSIARELAWLRTTPHRRASLIEWHLLAPQFPLSSAEVEAVLPQITSTRLKQLLNYASTVYSTALKALEPVDDQVAEPDTSALAAAGDSVAPRSKTYRRAPKRSEDPEDNRVKTSDEDENPKSLVRWAIAETTKGTHRRDRLGAISGWNHLHPEALRPVVRSLLRDFDSPDLDLRKFAVLALCCLHTGLPSRLAVQMPLERNDDLALDLDRGALVWNLRAILGSKHSYAARSEADLIAMRLDTRVLEDLRQLRGKCPAAITLGDLLAVPAAGDLRRDWLTCYRAYLRLHGENIRPPYDLRFASSLGRAYLHVTKSDVWPAFLALDFAHAAMGLLSYAHPNSSTLRRQEDAVAHFLGFKLENDCE